MFIYTNLAPDCLWYCAWEGPYSFVTGREGGNVYQHKSSAWLTVVLCVGGGPLALLEERNVFLHKLVLGCFWTCNLYIEMGPSVVYSKKRTCS